MHPAAAIHAAAARQDLNHDLEVCGEAAIHATWSLAFRSSWEAPTLKQDQEGSVSDGATVKDGLELGTRVTSGFGPGIAAR